MSKSYLQIINFLYAVLLVHVCLVLSNEEKNNRKCSKKVLVTKENNHKVAMIKRIPSRCSNWDKSWAWITKMDCSTKYVTTYVDNAIYMTKYECCPGDTSCQDKEEQKEYASEERFLIIILGSATAALTIIVIIIIISICHRKQYGTGFIFWKRHRCQYIPTNGKGSDLSIGCVIESRNQNEYVQNGDQKFIEPEYEEINDRSQDWCNVSEKVPVVDQIFEPSIENDITKEDISQNLLSKNENDTSNIEDKNRKDEDDITQLNSLMEYLNSPETSDTLQKHNLQSSKNEFMKDEEKDLCKTDNCDIIHNDRILNEYTDFGDLVKYDASENDEGKSDNVHKYESLDNSSREQRFRNQIYSPLDSVNTNESAQNVC